VCSSVRAAARRSFAAAASSKKVEVTAVECHRCDGPGSRTVSVTKEEYIEYFVQMQRMRKMEIAADLLYKEQMIRGFCHLYDGQEGVGVGMEAALQPQDCVITAYREHCNQLARGGTIHNVMAELTGRVTGISKGKGGSMHMYSREHNFFGGNGIVGAQVPVGAGLAFALKYQAHNGLDRSAVPVPACSVSMFGDGAANQGQIYEAMNMSMLWHLPAIFVCENNHYAMGTSTKRHSSTGDDFYNRYPTPGIRIDGMDVLAVRQGFQYARDFVCSGKGPITIEADTYRYHGHSMSDPGLSYRDRDEVKEWRKSRDPIMQAQLRMLEWGWIDEAGIKAIEAKVAEEVADAVKYAKESPEPPLPELYDHVLDEQPEFIRGPDLGNSVGQMPQ